MRSSDIERIKMIKKLVEEQLTFNMSEMTVYSFAVILQVEGTMKRLEVTSGRKHFQSPRVQNLIQNLSVNL